MKVKLRKDNLSFMISNAYHVAEKKTTMKVLSCLFFKFSSKGPTMEVCATNIRNSIQQRVKGGFSFDGGFAVQARILNDVVKSLPDEEFEMEIYDSSRMKISCGGFCSRIPILSEEEFPTLPKRESMKKGKGFTVSSNVLEKLIDKTGFSMSDDETRPYINGALFESGRDFMKMVTTDGHRMTVCRYSVEEEIEESKILIPFSGVQELKRFLAIGEDKVSISIDKSNMYFLKKVVMPDGSNGEMFLTVRLTESEFPPYESVIPRSNDKVCICSREAVLEAIKRVSVVLSTERYRTMNIFLSENQITFKAEHPDFGESEEVVEIGYSGKPLKIGFNSNYIMQVLGAIEEEEVEIKFGGELDGAIFKPRDSEDFLGIVMPVRL